MIKGIEASLRQWTIPAPLAGMLPGTSASFGPPRRSMSLTEYMQRHDTQSWVVEGPEIIPPPQPVIFGNPDPFFLTQWPNVLRPKKVFRLMGVTVCGPDGHMVGDNDTLISGTSWASVHDNTSAAFTPAKLYRRKRAVPRRRLHGRTAVLTSDWATGGFGHFVTDSLPRWRLIEAAGFSAKDFDQFVIFHPGSPTSQFLIRQAGIPEEKIVNYDPSCDLTCDELVGTTFPNKAPATSPASLEWLRRIAGETDARARIYISRAGFSRHPGNAGEIESLLSTRGFEEVYGHDGLAAVKAAQSAKLLVGVEGANLFNLCFAPAGCRVVLLLPPRLHFPYIPFLCEALGLECAVIPSEPAPHGTAPVFAIRHVEAALNWAEKGSA